MQRLAVEFKLITVQILCIGTDRSQQTVQTKIRLLLKKQSDQGLHCLPFHQHLLDALMQCYIKLITAVSNSFSGPLEKIPIAADADSFRVIFFFYVENGILCVLIKIASMRRS